jgi:hypothetical protein
MVTMKLKSQNIFDGATKPLKFEEIRFSTLLEVEIMNIACEKEIIAVAEKV